MSLLSINSSKGSLPTIQELLDDPFFSGVGIDDKRTKPYLKFSIGTKEALVKYRQMIESSLSEDHKKVTWTMLLLNY